MIIKQQRRIATRYDKTILERFPFSLAHSRMS